MIRVACIGHWYAMNFFRLLSDAFEELGCEVDRYGPTYRSHYDIEWYGAEEYFDSVKELVEPFRFETFDHDLILLQDWPELALTHIDPVKLLAFNGKIALFQPEGWQWAWKRKGILPTGSSQVYCAQPYGVHGQPYDTLGKSALDYGWNYLPGAADPSRHPLLHMERDIDVAFLANMYGYRPVFAGELTQRGFHVVTGQVPVADYAVFHNRAMCVIESGEGQEFIKWRTFEAMAMGCAVISTQCRLMDMVGFIPGMHYIKVDFADTSGTPPFAPNLDQVVAAIKMLKDDVQYRKDLTRRARNLVLNRHTYKHRACQILSDLGLLHELD